MTRCEVPLLAPVAPDAKPQPAQTYTVRLFFAALADDKPGQRVFDVKLQGNTVLKAFDMVTSTGGNKKAHVAEFTNIPVTENLLVEMLPANTGADEAHQPLLSGIEVLRTNAEEIRETVAGR